MSEDIKEAFEKTKIAGAIAAGALDQLSELIKPGITTDEIDKVCYEYISDFKAYSAPLYIQASELKHSLQIAICPTSTSLFGSPALSKSDLGLINCILRSDLKRRSESLHRHTRVGGPFV